MQRELHLATEDRYQQAFSTLHDERIETKRRSTLAQININAQFADTSQGNGNTRVAGPGGTVNVNV